MAFFEKLNTAGIVSRDGSIRGCIDEDFDGCTAGDLLTELLANADSDNCDVFSDKDRHEFIFQLFSALVIGGGALRQADSRVEAYENITRALYRALISVKKSIADANGKRDIEITSRVYRVSGDPLFRGSSSRFHSCFAIIDAQQFFESHVRSEMQLTSAARGDDEKNQQKSIQELLERVQKFQEEQQQLADGEDDEEALAKRMQELAMLDAAGELTLESLTLEERKRFLGEVADGRLGKLVKLWSPWWLMSERKYRSETSARRRQLILEEIGGGDDVEEKEEVETIGAVTVDPTVLYPVGLFTNHDAQKMPESMGALLPGGRQPSPCLRYHLVEVLFAYALVLRAFNGDYAQDVAEAAMLLLDICQVLSADARYESVEHVCLACLEKQSTEGATANALAVQDAQQILRADMFLLDALSDTRALLERYQQDLEGSSSEADKQVKKERKAALKKLAAVQKKLVFYQTWAYVTPAEEFHALAAEVEAYTKDKELLGAHGRRCLLRFKCCSPLVVLASRSRREDELLAGLAKLGRGDDETETARVRDVDGGVREGDSAALGADLVNHALFLVARQAVAAQHEIPLLGAEEAPTARHLEKSLRAGEREDGAHPDDRPDEVVDQHVVHFARGDRELLPFVVCEQQVEALLALERHGAGEQDALPGLEQAVPEAHERRPHDGHDRIVVLPLDGAAHVWPHGEHQVLEHLDLLGVQHAVVTQALAELEHLFHHHVLAAAVPHDLS
ncbi:hypothetical protein ON010_g9887 [Phytophthora cinnamomi]|nr:hypothetical protein ON010_g9887 [Phytophthora cinnamomi]